MDQTHQDMSYPLRTASWILVIVGASLGFSLGFSCATPFAALAAVAGAQLRRREAVVAVLLAWLGNQSIGYLVHHYPRTWDSFAWGGAIGMAGLLAVTVASLTASPRRFFARSVASFGAAFATYEATLFAASFILPSEGRAFALPVVVRILEVNFVAYAGLLVLHRLAAGAGLLTSGPQDRPALA